MPDFWGLQSNDPVTGAERFAVGDSSIMLIGSTTVTGKTASTPGNVDGWRTVTVPDVPANTDIWWQMTIVDPSTATLSVQYESSSQKISGTQFRYRIDRAAADTITIIEYGWRAL